MYVPKYTHSQIVLHIITGAGVPITSPQLYSAGHTDDLRQSLIYISHLFPEAPLLGIGFSLGANVMTRYIAEEGKNSRLRSGCALSCVSRSVCSKKNLSNSSSHGILLRITCGKCAVRVAWQLS